MIISLDLSGRRVLVVGSSVGALTRASSMAKSGARVVLVTNSKGKLPRNDVREFEIKNQQLKGRHLKGVFLVVATERDRELNQWLFRKSEKEKFLLNTLDEKETCNFYHTSVRKLHDSLELAISTGGASPAFASRLGNRLASQVSAEDIHVLEAFVSTRKKLRECNLSTFDFDWGTLDHLARENFQSRTLASKFDNTARFENIFDQAESGVLEECRLSSIPSTDKAVMLHHRERRA